MICPKCLKEMSYDDSDNDYVLYRGQKIMIKKRCWTICNECKISGYYETELQYQDENGEKLDFEPYVDDNDYSDMELG